MKSQPKKTGRKQVHHTDSLTGKPVVGLSKRPSDGRWRVIGTQITFTEPDEQRAIKRFRELTDQPKKDWETIGFEGSAIDEITKGFVMLDEDRFWAWVGRQIDERPKFVAAKTGHEKIAYLPKLTPPAPLPSLKQLRQTYLDYAKCSKEERSKVVRYWDRFVAETELKAIDEITPQLAVSYQDYIHGESYGGKMQQHLFNGVRTLLRFNKNRAVAVEVIGKALECLALMRPNESTVNRNPQPIDVTDFHSLLEAAAGSDKAMLLMMLNCALYCGEVVTVQWSEIKHGCYVSRRQKTGEQIRVATLWPETLKALKDVPHKGEYVFNSAHGSVINKFTAFERFRSIRKDAELSDSVKPSHIRDGAYTAAVEANVTSQLCNIFVGHTNGMQDAYVLANPSIVKPACEAVRNKYFVNKPTQA